MVDALVVVDGGLVLTPPPVVPPPFVNTFACCVPDWAGEPGLGSCINLICADELIGYHCEDLFFEVCVGIHCANLHLGPFSSHTVCGIPPAPPIGVECVFSHPC